MGEDTAYMKKVLVVEDEGALRDILAEELQGEGIWVLTAHEGRKGLEMALQEHPDLILLDLLMPQMDGISMLKELREDTWGEDAKVLILTNAEQDAQKMMEALDQGVFEYVVKSRWTMKEVVARVKERLGLSQ